SYDSGSPPLSFTEAFFKTCAAQRLFCLREQFIDVRLLFKTPPMNLIHPYFFAECRIFVLTSKLTLDLVPSFPIHGPGGLQHCPVDFPEHESRVGKKPTLNLPANGHFVHPLSQKPKPVAPCRSKIHLPRREPILHLRLPHVSPG